MNGEFGARNRREPSAAFSSWGRPGGGGGVWHEASAASASPYGGGGGGGGFDTAPAAAPPGGCRDRTGEFRAVVTQMRGGVAGSRRGGPPSSASLSPAAGAVRRRFAQHARHIGADLARTETKLEKLALLATRPDWGRGPEWTELAQIVGQDVSALNHAIAALQEAAKGFVGGGGGGHGYSGQQAAAHSSAVVLALQTRLADMSGRYRDALESPQQPQPHQNPASQQHRTQSSAAFPADSQDPSGVHRSQSDVSIDMSAVGSGGGGGLSQQRQVERSDRYLSERADTMHTIEQTMVDLGSVFQQLATIVKEQDELVHRIGASVEDTTLNVEVAHEELLKFFKSLTTNRRLMLKVFCLLIVFFVLFVVFLR